MVVVPPCFIIELVLRNKLLSASLTFFLEKAVCKEKADIPN